MSGVRRMLRSTISDRITYKSAAKQVLCEAGLYHFPTDLLKPTFILGFVLLCRVCEIKTDEKQLRRR